MPKLSAKYQMLGNIITLFLKIMVMWGAKFLLHIMDKCYE